MHFEYTNEQNTLRNALARFIAENYTLADRQALLGSEAGYSKQHWRFFAEMGLLALPFAQQYGGLDGGADDVMLVMEMLGRGLIVEPYFPVIILAGGLLSRCASEQAKTSLLPPLIEGRLICTLAHIEPRQDNDADMPGSMPGACLTASATGYLLSGKKTLVIQGANAERFIVTANDGGSDGEGLIILLINADAPGVEQRPYRTVDGIPACDLIFDEVVVQPEQILAAGKPAQAALHDTLTHACACLCAESYGCMQTLFDMTLDYVQVRKQFNRPIGSFQVVQHRLAELYADCEQAKSMMLLANLGEYDAQWHRNVAAAKAFINEKAINMGHAAIQLHGGMGVSDELAIGHYHRRLLMTTALFGGTDQQLDALQRLAA